MKKTVSGTLSKGLRAENGDRAICSLKSVETGKTKEVVIPNNGKL